MMQIHYAAKTAAGLTAQYVRLTENLPEHRSRIGKSPARKPARLAVRLGYLP